jgi:hypothetical protein
MRQYAQQEGMKWMKLAKWCHLQGRASDGKQVRFTEVELGTSATRGGDAPPSWAFEVTLPNGWVVRAADAGALAQLLQVAGR